MKPSGVGPSHAPTTNASRPEEDAGDSLLPPPPPPDEHYGSWSVVVGDADPGSQNSRGFEVASKPDHSTDNSEPDQYIDPGGNRKRSMKMESPPAKNARLFSFGTEQVATDAANPLCQNNVKSAGLDPSHAATTAPLRPQGEAQPTLAQPAPPPVVQDLLGPLIGIGMDEKPRPFSNATPVWGSGSCYMNAGLQLLFASCSVREHLARLIFRRNCDTEHARRVWSFCTITPLGDIRRSQTAEAPTWDDNTLALTFASAMQGQTSVGASVRGRPLLPALFLRECYTGAQEDASLFVMNCLQSCPQTLQLFSGSYTRAKLKCALCGNCELVGSTSDEQEFTTLQLETRSHDTRLPFDTMEAALNAACQEPLDEHFRSRCSNAACGGRWHCKVYPVEEPPQVLLLQLKSWEYFLDDGVMTARRLPCSLRIAQTIKVANVTYTLKGLVYHSGESPQAGHYVTVARHGGTVEPFFLYNDACRRGIAQSALACTMTLPGSVNTAQFHVTAFLYEQ